MKKKLISVLCVLVVLVLAATLIGPYVILNAVRQPEVTENYAAGRGAALRTWQCMLRLVAPMM